MTQIVVLSGKGGTGKTSLVASFAAIANDTVVVDCDVDAPDLHLLLRPSVLKVKDFYGEDLAFIDKEKCIKCGLCIQNCRFNAINSDFEIDNLSCEGCGVCSIVCPTQAVTTVKQKAGEVYISKTAYGLMVHALLFLGQENSGKLVTMTRLIAAAVASEQRKSLILIDGSPGIGCPVIASVTNVDYAMIVTEPTESGIHDLKRLLELLKIFSIKPFVCINKFDINEENTKRIQEFCELEKIPIGGKIPFDPVFVDAMVNGKTVIEYARDSAVAKELTNIWSKVNAIINNKKEE